MNTTWNTNGGVPTMPDHNNPMRSKTYTNSSRYNRGIEQQPRAQPGAPNPVDLQSMYYDQTNSFYQQQPYPGHFNQFSSPNMYSNESMNGGPYMQRYNQEQQQNYQPNFQSSEGGMNLNPYATEFSPFPAGNNTPAPNHRHSFGSNRGQHYKDEFTTDYSNQYKVSREMPNNNIAAVVRQASEESNPVIEIPEGAVTVTMPHIYLGKFIMNRSEFESKYRVSITTNSKDGGYLIIITGEQAEAAGREVEKMWNEEPITSSDNITEGKHVIKVAPDRYEGVFCVPTEYYQALLAKRNAVESNHKVRILIKQLQANNCYRAVIRANKKSTAAEATDELEKLVMSADLNEAVTS